MSRSLLCFPGRRNHERQELFVRLLKTFLRCLRCLHTSPPDRPTNSEVNGVVSPQESCLRIMFLDSSVSACVHARRLSRTRSGKCFETLRPGTGAKPEVIHLGRSTTDSCGVCRYVCRKRHASLELSQEEAFALPHSASLF